MPRVGSFYNPPPCLVSYLYQSFFLFSVTDMWDVPSIDRFYISISGKSYPLSRHRFCFFNDLLITTLSSVSVAAFMSRVFADIMTTDIGMPRWSVRTRRLVPNLPLPVGFGPIMSPPKGAFTDTLSSDCHVHLMPLRSSYISNSLTHN